MHSNEGWLTIKRDEQIVIKKSKPLETQLQKFEKFLGSKYNYKKIGVKIEYKVKLRDQNEIKLRF